MRAMRTALALCILVHLIACIITGEAGVLPEAGPRVAEVAVNRWPIWGASGWHRIAQRPAPWAYDMALEAILAGPHPEGPLFCLSKDDIERLGFDKDLWERIEARGWELWIGREWR